MSEELLKALKTIKEECESHGRYGCVGCPMMDGKGNCGVTENAPNRWPLEKREVYF